MKSFFPFLLLFILLISCDEQAIVNEINATSATEPIIEKLNPKIKSKISDTTLLAQSHTLNHDLIPITFTNKMKDQAWMYSGGSWRFARTEVDNIDEISDSILLNIELLPSRVKNKDGRISTAISIQKDEILIAAAGHRYNDYYAIRILDVEGSKVKLDHKLFQLDEVPLSRLTTRQALQYIVANTELDFLNQLAQSNPEDLSRCQNLENFIRTPLIYAIHKKNKEVFDGLIKHKVRLDEVCKHGFTALHRTVLMSDPHFFEELIKAGARYDIKNKSGETVIDKLNKHSNSRNRKRLNFIKSFEKMK